MYRYCCCQPLLKPLVVEADELVVVAGEIGDEMFFITSGRVEVLSSNGEEVYASRAQVIPPSPPLPLTLIQR